jgi:two-component sensor histidine kinase
MGGPRLRLDIRLPVSADALSMARGALDDALDPRHLDPSIAADIRVAVTELVSNVLQHGCLEPSGSFRLTANDPCGIVHVEVHQASSAEEVQRSEDPRSTKDPGGFGLRLVEKMTDRWGVVRGPPGMVWFELDPEAPKARA